MRTSQGLGLGLAVAASGAALAQPAQKVTGPVATYWVSAQTQSGFGMPSIAGGAPDRGAMMRAMMGGGGAQHLLTLQLGSERKASGEPHAEHLPPPGLGAGPTLPLVTPRAEPAVRGEPAGDVPHEFQKPRGRMLFFWGCGEHARPGQPLVVDFAQVKPGQMPPGMAAMMRGIGSARAQPPAPGRSTTYGEWPNERARSSVPPQGSLLGEHTVRGDYTPDIRFALGAGQDFMAPLVLSTNARVASGAVQLAWNAVPNATGYLAGVMGGDGDTMVAWTSSEAQASPFALPEFLPPAEAARLVQARALLGPQTTTCAVPKEVADAAPQAMLQLVAYGPEANFVDPPRPTSPKTPWNRNWAVKVRYRSATGGLLGMAMPGAEANDRGEQPGEPGRKRKKPSIMRGLGGAMGLPVPGF